MGARNAPSMAPYGPGPGYPAPSSQVAGAAVGRAGIRGVWQMAPAMVISRFTPLTGSTPCVEALALPSPRPPATHGAAFPPFRRADHGGSARFESFRSGLVRPIESNPIQGSHALALSPHTSPLSTGWRGWGGGPIRRHGWRLMSPHGRVHGGSRHPTHGVPPRIKLECSLCLCLRLRLRLGAGRGRHGICPRSPLNTCPVILRLSRRPRGH